MWLLDMLSLCPSCLRVGRYVCRDLEQKCAVFADPFVRCVLSLEFFFFGKQNNHHEHGRLWVAPVCRFFETHDKNTDNVKQSTFRRNIHSVFSSCSPLSV